jgi:O-acetylhomoserine/O-acetylserine sulfhydrylase-like pyridoxal-dependent enzyme
MLAQSERALALAQWLERHPRVSHASTTRVCRATRSMRSPCASSARAGPLLSFDVKGGQAAAWG